MNNEFVYYSFSIAEKTMVMYYVEVVPTDIETFASHIKTYQYSVKENVRIIGKLRQSQLISFAEVSLLLSHTDHDHGSHGMPGIYIKYDVSALKVHVLLGRENLIKMAVRLCSVISGIVVISKFISRVLLKCWETFLKRFAPQVYEISQEKLPMKHDPTKVQNIYDVLLNSSTQKSNSTANINLLTNNILVSNPVTLGSK